MTIFMLQWDTILQESEEELDLNYMKNNGKDQKFKYALTNSLGFGGHNASLILKKFEEQES